MSLGDILKFRQKGDRTKFWINRASKKRKEVETTEAEMDTYRRLLEESRRMAEQMRPISPAIPWQNQWQQTTTGTFNQGVYSQLGNTYGLGR